MNDVFQRAEESWSVFSQACRNLPWPSVGSEKNAGNQEPQQPGIGYFAPDRVVLSAPFCSFPSKYRRVRKFVVNWVIKLRGGMTTSQ
jgi:hypothetical protein